jgi:lysyl-tRNA synthetase class 2
LERFEELVAAVCLAVRGSTRICYQGIALELAPPWRRLTVLQALKEYAQVDATDMEATALERELQRRGLEYDPPLTWGEGVMAFFEATCENQLIEPTFILDHPLEVCPLAKVKRGDARLAERFEPYICGMEMGNAYSEQTDPVEQAERFGGMPPRRR